MSTLETFPLRKTPENELVILRSATGHGCDTRMNFQDWFEAARGRAAHRAQDLMAPQGTIVVAPVTGTVVAVRTTPKGGNTVTIKADSDGWEHYLAHMRDASTLREGEHVVAGEYVGRVGRTGNAQAVCPHLHYSVERRTAAGLEKFNHYRQLVALRSHYDDPFPVATGAVLPSRKLRA